MKFYQSGAPSAKKRHRTSNGRVYDPQHLEKLKLKWLFAAQLRDQGYTESLKCPVEVHLEVGVPIPKSWSKKRKEKALGRFVTTKPDLDNYEKMYFDVLNKIAYLDDSQISSIFSQKRYSNEPGIEIIINKLEDNMFNEHAIVYKEKLSVEDISYIIKKANRLGLKNRQIIGAYQEEDEEGTHIYFMVEGPKEKETDECF